MKELSKTGSPASKPLVELVDNRWSLADEDEAKLLVKIMTLFNNHYWCKYCFAAERKEIPHSDMISENEDNLRGSWTSGLADWDGTATRKPYEPEDLERQRAVLDNYLAKFSDAIGENNVKLVNEAKANISA